MQKFTRPLRREIEVAGERLALTFGEQGLAVRPVGARRPAVEASWSAVVARLFGTSSAAAEPSADELTSALRTVRAGGAARLANPPSVAAASAAPPATPKRLQGILTRLDQWLRKHRPGFVKQLRPGASAKDLSNLEAALGVPTPEELRALLAWHNGQDAGSTAGFEEDWMLMSTADIAEARQALSNAPQLKGFVPFLDDDAGNYLGIDVASPGRPVSMYGEDTPTERRIVSPSMGAWLEDFVSACEQGDYREDPERGSFLKTSGKA